MSRKTVSCDDLIIFSYLEDVSLPSNFSSSLFRIRRWRHSVQDPDIYPRTLLDIIKDRHERKSITVTSQLPVTEWYDVIGNPTVDNTILDRIHRSLSISD